MKLAGAHHLTISPPLLRQLADTARTNAYNAHPSLFDLTEEELEAPPRHRLNDNEEEFRMAFTLDHWGANEVKQIQASLTLSERQIQA